MSTDSTTGGARCPLPDSTADLVPVLFGHAAFQHLYAACELGLHELLDEQPRLTADQIGHQLGLADRSLSILLLGASALGLLRRVDDHYENGPAIAAIFRADSWTIFRDIVKFEAEIAYVSHSAYVKSLRENTTAGIECFEGTEPDLYQRLANTPRLQELFYRCMNSWSRVSNFILTDNTWFTGCRHILDVGGGDGVNALALVRAFEDLTVTVLDLDGAVALARAEAERRSLGCRIRAIAGDIFTAPYPPTVDCVLLANQIPIWSPEDNLRLIRRAHEALPAGGRLVVYNEFVNDTLDGPLYAALDNVYFATLPTRDSRLYPARDCIDWVRSAGFRDAVFRPGTTWTPHGAVLGIK